MPKCSYCGSDYEYPRGLTYVLADGTVKLLCSSKCKKNMALGRRKVRWISKSEAGKEGFVHKPPTSKKKVKKKSAKAKKKRARKK